MRSIGICKVLKQEYSKSIDKRYAKAIDHVPEEIDMDKKNVKMISN